MLIEEKLALSEHNQKVSFIGEGLFCNLFNQSAYIVTELLGFKLRLKVKQIKKLDNKMIIMTGFPNQSMVKFFPEAVATEWGFELHGDWDLSGYAEWLARHVAQAACEAEHDAKEKHNTEIVTPNQVDDVACKAARVYLTAQQESFLATWEREKYPVHVDIGFLESLKLHLLSLKNEVERGK